MKKDKTENTGMLILIDMKKMLPENVKLRSIRADSLLHAQQLIVQLLLFICNTEKYSMRTSVTSPNELLFNIHVNRHKLRIKLSLSETDANGFLGEGKWFEFNMEE